MATKQLKKLDPVQVSLINNDCWVFEDAKVWGNAKVFEDAKVCGKAEVCGNAEVWGDAKVCGNADCLVFHAGEYKRVTTVTLSNKKISCGCFYGDIKEFEEAVKEKYKDTKTDYYLYIDLIKKYFEQ